MSSMTASSHDAYLGSLALEAERDACNLFVLQYSS